MPNPEHKPYHEAYKAETSWKNLTFLEKRVIKILALNKETTVFPTETSTAIKIWEYNKNNQRKIDASKKTREMSQK